MAAKEMKTKSSQMLAEEMKKSMSLENVKKMNASKHVRRTSLVHDVLHVEHDVARERRMSTINRKPSLVADVTYHPADSWAKTLPQRLQFLGKSQSRKAIEGEAGRCERERELASLKFSKAGNAARMAAQDTHKEHERSKRTYSVVPTTVEHDDKASRLEKWRMKCMRLLNKQVVFGNEFSFKLIQQ
jgi:hypothetical protein